MSLPLIGFSVLCRGLGSPEDAFAPFVNAFFSDLLDPKSVRLSWLSLSGTDFYTFPKSLPPTPFDPPLFADEYYPDALGVSKLRPNEQFFQFARSRDSVCEKWCEWVQRFTHHVGELSIECWGLAHLWIAKDGEIERDWFLMEAVRLNESAIRVPLVDIALKSVGDGQVVLYLFTHSMLWTKYSYAPGASKIAGRGYAFTVKDAQDLQVAQLNCKNLVAAVRRFIETTSCTSWEWSSETEKSACDIDGLFRHELTMALGPP